MLCIWIIKNQLAKGSLPMFRVEGGWKELREAKTKLLKILMRPRMKSNDADLFRQRSDLSPLCCVDQLVNIWWNLFFSHCTFHCNRRLEEQLGCSLCHQVFLTKMSQQPWAHSNIARPPCITKQLLWEGKHAKLGELTFIGPASSACRVATSPDFKINTSVGRNHLWTGERRCTLLICRFANKGNETQWKPEIRRCCSI